MWYLESVVQIEKGCYIALNQAVNQPILASAQKVIVTVHNGLLKLNSLTS